MRENVIGRLLDTTFGVRGRFNLISWALAGGAAYFFIYAPEQRKAAERKVLYEQKRRHYEEKGMWDIDRVKPVPDKQQNGLVVGVSPEARQQQQQQREGGAKEA
ncbi:hypothetical protein TSOC_007001 [Tetrabaena socialis]|uniref:Uncharacterized protein n=1 Tax=Tetrabaena socialis TaxID=47790 RepID=A0A2J8A281_9CHLO|nr:hypothetical protein TSOC_007001 [Tetrabaena socialis]|eukprot:PNH06624.1 hypothetical protein TSOC_007001 [Tetrabaena socialis]